MRQPKYYTVEICERISIMEGEIRMLHPSYTDLMEVVNSDVEPGEQPIVQSRYSIVLATAKRARQLIAGDEPLVKVKSVDKPLSIAIEELYESKIKIISDDNNEEE